jgi:DNA-directed RNA polymerase specialized sigma24 family protein
VCSSVPSHDDETYGLFGLSWAEIFKLRDQLAHTYYRHFRRRVPIEELWSAGNLAIAVACRDFPRATSGAPFRNYLGRTITLRFHEYWNRHANKKVERGTCYGYPLARLPTSAGYERRHDAARVLAHLASLSTARNRAMLLAWLDGESEDAIGRIYGLNGTSVGRAIQPILQALQAWSWHGESSPPPIQRRVVRLTPHDHATIQRLAQAGTPIGVLKRRYGCDRTTIRKAIRQGAEV